MKKNTSAKKTRGTVLLLENIHPNAVALFESAGYTVRTHAKALSEDELCDALRGVTVLGIRSKTKVTRRVLASAPELRAIGAFCIGTNQIDCGAATEHGVAVFNAPFSNTRSVVELVIGEIIMLLRKTFDASAGVHRGEWAKSAAGCYEVRGKKLGIVGYGNIGTQLSVLAEALGMQVAFYDVRERLALGNARKMKSLAELLAWADIVTLHVDGRKENTDLIGKKEFARMKEGAYFLNLSRGHVVVIDALVDALKSGHITGAAVDVFPQEPKGNDEAFVNPLQGCANVILTPHVGGSTEEAQEHIGMFASNKLLQYLATGDTTLSVNMPQVAVEVHAEATFRFVHVHDNVPGMLAAINELLASNGVNVVSQQLKTHERVGVVVTECAGVVAPKVHNALRDIPHTIRCIVL